MRKNPTHINQKYLRRGESSQEAFYVNNVIDQLEEVFDSLEVENSTPRVKVDCCQTAQSKDFKIFGRMDFLIRFLEDVVLLAVNGTRVEDLPLVELSLEKMDDNLVITLENNGFAGHDDLICWNRFINEHFKGKVINTTDYDNNVLFIYLPIYSLDPQ